ncbi:MAG: OprO/OprP family phosphate-selective porin [Bacteroidetes bacterium]|nr:OprO/OprP family phosphate-selective porin [Bacteroidota bacterium]
MRIGNFLFSVIFTLLLVNTQTFGQDELFSSGTSIGGYGELHYNYSKPENGNETKTLDFHRFVMFYSYRWNESWSFKSEVELEHNFVSDGQGELELEQAYVDYHHADWFGFQAGVILPSIGLINEFHEPPLFLSVERPDYSKNIIPTTWFGNGIAFYGNYSGFDYKVTVMEGLDADGFSAKSGIRGGRLKGFKSDAENFLYNFRLDYLKVPGLKMGASFTFNEATGDSINNAISLFEIHAKYNANNIFASFEYGNISYDKGDVETSSGFYADLGFDIGSMMDLKTKVVPFVRYSDYNTAASTITGGESEQKYHARKWMIGLAIFPIESVVFKVDYSLNTVELGDSETTLFNLGVGYMF